MLAVVDIRVWVVAVDDDTCTFRPSYMAAVVVAAGDMPPSDSWRVRLQAHKYADSVPQSDHRHP